MKNRKKSFILLYMALAMSSNTMYAGSSNKNSYSNAEQLKKIETNGARANWSVEFYEYVVITKRDLIPAFNKLLTWKKQKGLNAGAVAVEDILNDPAAAGGDLISGINDNAGKIRQYLRASKDSIGKVGKVSEDCIGKYVLLGGMGDIVPFRYACGNNNSWVYDKNDAKIPSDFYFSQLDGNWNTDNDEFYGEINDDDIYALNVKDPLYLYVGRLLCRTIDDVERWTRKQLLYEQNPGLGDYEYLRQALITRSDGLNDNIIGKQNSVLPSTITPTTIMETPNTDNPIGPSGSEIIELINKNHYGLLFNTNHGSPWGYAVATIGRNEDIESSKMFVLARDSYDEIYKKNGKKVLFTAKHELRNGFDNLTNYNHPAVLLSNSCDNIPFDDYDNYYRDYGMRNLGEAFLCENEGGGIAYLGNTRIGYNNENVVNRILRLILQEPSKNRRLGELEYNSKTSALLGSRGEFPWMIRTHNLAGCPETYLWKELPKKFGNITVSPDGIGNLWVNNVNLNNAIVCVTSANDGGVSYRKTSKITNSNKNPKFTNVPNDYVVVVTLDGYIPYIYHSNECTIQKETFTGTEKRDCKNIVAGAHVTTSKPEGDVVIKSGANVTFDAQNTTRIEGGFQVELGGQLKIK